jgi:hypothetical protein
MTVGAFYVSGPVAAPVASAPLAAIFVAVPVAAPIPAGFVSADQVPLVVSGSSCFPFERMNY